MVVTTRNIRITLGSVRWRAMSDLEAILCEAFAPLPTPVRHVELQVFCAVCGVQMDSLFPALGIPTETKLLAEELVGRACECGVTWSDPSGLAVTIAPVEPSERGYAYCLVCRQIWKVADLEPWSTGLRCRGCTALAEAVDEYEAAWKEPWNVPVRDLHIGAADRLPDRNVVSEVSAMSERRYRTALGDSRLILKTLADDSVDSIVTDPPYALKFMNSKWDTGEIVHDVEFWRKVLRVLKPGGHLLAFSSTRTYHRMTCAIEDAGFEVRDCCIWMHGQGMPKSSNVSKSLDRMAGAEREVVGMRSGKGGENLNLLARAEGKDDPAARGCGAYGVGAHQVNVAIPVTAPATDEAKQWDGWGSALKPCWEPIVLCRKPIEGTIAGNILAHGAGGLNVDATRIGRAADDAPGWHETGAKGSGGFQDTDTFKIHDMMPEEVQARCSKGRWPANAIIQHSEKCQLVGQRRIKGCPAVVTQGGQDGGGFDVGVEVTRQRRSEFAGYGDEDGLEGVDEWACVPGCPARVLDDSVGLRRSGKMKAGTKRANTMGYAGAMPDETLHETYGDQGGVSRFLYQAKPSKAERERGLLGVVPCHKCGGLDTTTHVDQKTGNTVKCLRNHHNTLKSVDLMRWLVRLVTPPGGTCLDMFAGSFTTGVAALLEGFQFLGIESDPGYYVIGRARLAHAEDNAPPNS